MGVCDCSMFCCALLYVPSSFAIILMGKRELVALLGLSFWCLMIVVWLFLAVPWCLQFVIVVFPDHTHYFGPPLTELSGSAHVLRWRIFALKTGWIAVHWTGIMIKKIVS